MGKMSFSEWELQHKHKIEKLAAQTDQPYSEILAAASYAWENGKMDTGQHFEVQCPYLGNLPRENELRKLTRSAFYHARQKK